MENNKSFLGVGWSFPPSFSAEAGIKMVADETDVQQSLAILLTTEIGERLMRPTYGCDLAPEIFEPLDTTRKAYIKDLIRTAILYHEPRVRLNNVTLVANTNEGFLEVEIEYTVRTTNSRNNLVLPYYLDEPR